MIVSAIERRRFNDVHARYVDWQVRCLMAAQGFYPVEQVLAALV